MNYVLNTLKKSRIDVLNQRTYLAFRNAFFLLFILYGALGCSSVNDKNKMLSKEKADDIHFSESEQKARKGFEYLVKGKPDKASENFNLALRMNPADSRFHLLNAISYHMKVSEGDYSAADLAKEGYKLAIERDENNWVAYYMFGRLQLELNEFDDAIVSLTQALSLNSNEPQIMKAMAYAFYSKGDPVTASAMISRLEKLDALKSSADYKNAAIINAALGEQEKSQAFFQEYTSRNISPWRDEHIERRINDWKNLYANVNSNKVPSNFIKTVDSPQLMNDPSPAPFYDPLEGKMVVVDVVIISAEDVIGTSKGVNLLNGLKIQFGADQLRSTYNDAGKEVAEGVATKFSTETKSDILTKTVSVPALNYSLNIFNSNSRRNEVLARPTITAMVGKSSDFFSGVELNAAAVSQGQGDGKAVEINKQIGVYLNVTPLMVDKDTIDLLVGVSRTFLKSPSPDVNFTFKVETSKTTVNSNVRMKYGETLILSGLSEKESENARDGVPFLQDIPLIQYFFSNRETREFQRSVLILLTPRPANFVYQPDGIRQQRELSMSPSERAAADLQAQYSDWFKPYPNWASVFNQMNSNRLYREFRTADVELEDWYSNEDIWSRLRQSIDFLWY